MKWVYNFLNYLFKSHHDNEHQWWVKQCTNLYQAWWINNSKQTNKPNKQTKEKRKHNYD